MRFRGRAGKSRKMDNYSSVSSLESQIGLLQTDHSWANAGVLLGGRMRLEDSFRNN